MIESICVFCGSSGGRRPSCVAAAAEFGRATAERAIRLVCGGASVRLMGAVADAALARLHVVERPCMSARLIAAASSPSRG
jgi:predicted Rossmann-fold nucleotide-binding protein